jgi:hypothetical protein
VSEAQRREATRRITVTLVKPWFALYWGIKPTLVIAGLGQPAQWGEGTWLVPDDRPSTIGVFLFNRMWRFGRAELELHPQDSALTYRAPVLPFLRGRLR